MRHGGDEKPDPRWVGGGERVGGRKTRHPKEWTTRISRRDGELCQRFGDKGRLATPGEHSVIRRPSSSSRGRDDRSQSRMGCAVRRRERAGVLHVSRWRHGSDHGGIGCPGCQGKAELGDVEPTLPISRFAGRRHARFDPSHADWVIHHQQAQHKAKCEETEAWKTSMLLGRAETNGDCVDRGSVSAHVLEMSAIGHTG